MSPAAAAALSSAASECAQQAYASSDECVRTSHGAAATADQLARAGEAMQQASRDNRLQAENEKLALERRQSDLDATAKKLELRNKELQE